MTASNETRAQASRQEAPAPAHPFEGFSILSGFPDVGTVDDVASALNSNPVPCASFADREPSGL